MAASVWIDLWYELDNSVLSCYPWLVVCGADPYIHVHSLSLSLTLAACCYSIAGSSSWFCQHKLRIVASTRFFLHPTMYHYWSIPSFLTYIMYECRPSLQTVYMYMYSNMEGAECFVYLINSCTWTYLLFDQLHHGSSVILESYVISTTKYVKYTWYFTLLCCSRAVYL